MPPGFLSFIEILKYGSGLIIDINLTSVLNFNQQFQMNKILYILICLLLSFSLCKCTIHLQ